MEREKLDEMMRFGSCEIKCPRCGRIWVTSLNVEWCNCLYCETKLDPKKHLVVSDESEVN